MSEAILSSFLTSSTSEILSSCAVSLLSASTKLHLVLGGAHLDVMSIPVPVHMSTTRKSNCHCHKSPIVPSCSSKIVCLSADFEGARDICTEQTRQGHIET